MKIKRHKSNKKPWIVLSVVLIIILASGLTYALTRPAPVTSNGSDTSSSGKSVNLSKPTTDQQQAGENQKKESLDKEKSGSSGVASTFEVTITASQQTSNTFQIRALINAIIGSGTCTLTLIKDASTVTKTAQVQPSASSSTCSGFDIPLTELSSGEWELNLSVSSGPSKGSISKKVTIQ